MQSLVDIRASGGAWFDTILHEPDLGVKRMEVAAGTVLYDPDAPAKEIHVIHSGQVRLYQTGSDGSAQLLAILGPGEWIGASSLGGAATHGKRAVAVTDSIISEIPVDRLFAVLLRRPEIAVVLIRLLAMRVRTTREQAARLVFDDCHHRLIKTLLHFSTSAAAVPQGQDVALHITHQQLAQAVGAARETVSLALTRLRRQGLIRTGRNQVVFNPEDLRRHADEAPAPEAESLH